MTALSLLLDHYHQSSMSEREKGTYFEELMLCYPMELFQRVVTVSVETIRIVRPLPKLDIAPAAS